MRNIGRLDERITYQERTQQDVSGILGNPPAADGRGQFGQTWGTFNIDLNPSADVSDPFTPGDDDSGMTNLVDTLWQDVLTVWAQVVMKEASEKLDVGAELGRQVADFVIRYNPTTAIKTKSSRIKYGTRYFEIISVVEVGRRDFLKVRGVEAV
tara:strand:- start:2915 stop:3376 length:462 start_codon:yes stop_codon:yes gene_type:complete